MAVTVQRGRDSRWVGWAIAFVYLAHSIVTIAMPRTDKALPLRDALRGIHYTIGLLLLVLVVIRLVQWRREPRMAPPAAVGAGVWRFWLRCALLTYVLIALAPWLGFLQAWSDGLTVRFAGAPLPALLAEDYALWRFSGYFHSAIGFTLLLLNLAAVITAGVVWIRRRVGLFAALPAGYGVQAWFALCCTFYALGKGLPGVVVLVAVTAIVFGVGAIRRTRHASWASKSAAGFGGGSLLGIAALLALGLYLPHVAFRVSPFMSGEIVMAPPAVRSHAAPVMRVTVVAEDALEREVRAETYKWCAFCHKTTRGEKHLVGPNLYAIFGQRAATVPNFPYSPAMAEAGRRGLVWNDETLDAFLADPDHFIPGTSMIISTGPVRDAEHRKRVINILKKETMAGAIDGPLN